MIGLQAIVWIIRYARIVRARVPVGERSYSWMDALRWASASYCDAVDEYAESGEDFPTPAEAFDAEMADHLED